MKNIVFLVIISITISLFTSCKKDNKVEEDVISPIVNFKFNPLANGLPLLNENQRIFNSSKKSTAPRDSRVLFRKKLKNLSKNFSFSCFCIIFVL